MDFLYPTILVLKYRSFSSWGTRLLASYKYTINYKYVRLVLLWVLLCLWEQPAWEFWIPVAKGGSACNLQKENCQPAQHIGKWNLGPPFPLGTKASSIHREANFAAPTRCSFSFHIYPLSPSSVWCGTRGVTLSLEQGGCKTHPHCA